VRGGFRYDKAVVCLATSEGLVQFVRFWRRLDVELNLQMMAQPVVGVDDLSPFSSFSIHRHDGPIDLFLKRIDL